VYLPDAERGFYRGARFDWSGMVGRVEYDGHVWYGPLTEKHNPVWHDDVAGTAEEFGVEDPPSYAEAKPGETFVKIGVGVLERADEGAYKFWVPYRLVQAGAWELDPQPASIQFRQVLQGPRGWAYEYTKSVSVAADKPEITIARSLRNTGARPIQTLHYGHNFTYIDDQPADASYRVRFPYPPRLGENRINNGCVGLEGSDLVPNKKFAGDITFWTHIEGRAGVEDSRFAVMNLATGGSVTVVTDQPLAKLVVYGKRPTICPEPFVTVSVEPGQQQAWTTRYTFSVSRP
jgi:hypothetical protein